MLHIVYDISRLSCFGMQMGVVQHEFVQFRGDFCLAHRYVLSSNVAALFIHQESSCLVFAKI